MLDLDLDKQGGRCSTHDKSKGIVENMMDSLDLVDVWRELNPDVMQYTWRKLNPHPIFVRLDFYLISSMLLQFIKNCNITYGYRTDHSSVMLEMQFELSVKGLGYWKFNNRLLRDKDYLIKIGNLIDIQFSQPIGSKKTAWELFKLAFRGSTIQYALRKKKSKKLKLEVLKRKVTQIQAKQSNLPSILRESNRTQIAKLNQEINEILAEQAAGAVMHSRSNWQFAADRPSKYFLSLEKRNYYKKTIYKLETDAGEIITDPQLI